jgi:hypothetical protein
MWDVWCKNVKWNRDHKIYSEYYFNWFRFVRVHERRNIQFDWIYDHNILHDSIYYCVLYMFIGFNIIILVNIILVNILRCWRERFQIILRVKERN